MAVARPHQVWPRRPSSTAITSPRSAQPAVHHVAECSGAPRTASVCHWRRASAWRAAWNRSPRRRRSTPRAPPPRWIDPIEPAPSGATASPRRAEAPRCGKASTFGTTVQSRAAWRRRRPDNASSVAPSIVLLVVQLSVRRMTSGAASGAELADTLVRRIAVGLKGDDDLALYSRAAARTAVLCRMMPVDDEDAVRLADIESPSAPRNSASRATRSQCGSPSSRPDATSNPSRSGRLCRPGNSNHTACRA